MSGHQTSTRRSVIASGTAAMMLPMVSRLASASPTPLLPLAAREASVGMSFSGEATLRVLGLRIYDARLWVGPNFRVDRFDQFPLLLELHYHRAFSARQIAARSLVEIRRQRDLDAEQAERWLAELIKLIPDVRSGERLTSHFQPGHGMRLWHGEQDRGSIADPELAHRFFGIWLSTKTSEPALRQALLSRPTPASP